LARIHAIDPGLLPELEAVPESGDPLAAWLGYLDRWEEPHPALELAFRWLERHRPTHTQRTLLHGDFRVGNVLVGGEGIRALLDWECAHFGDPLEDFGWLCTRSWRFEHPERPAAGIGLRENLYRAYEAAGGRAVDREAARWWEIFGLARWALYNVMQIYGHVSGRRRSPAFAACGRNTCLIEYDLLMTIAGRYD
ncbi:MAG: phosphotransferase family protein, partial [Gammaproteobacteria bacterium]